MSVAGEWEISRGGESGGIGRWGRGLGEENGSLQVRRLLATGCEEDFVGYKPQGARRISLLVNFYREYVVPPLVVLPEAGFGPTRSFLNPCWLVLLCSSSPKMATPPEEDPWRFDLDLDMAEVSWFFYDGDNRAKASRI